MFFFFNDTATTEIYTLSLHDALPISVAARWGRVATLVAAACALPYFGLRMLWLTPWPLDLTAEDLAASPETRRSEEHTSELQSRQYLVCRLLLEKKKIHPIYFLHYST